MKRCGVKLKLSGQPFQVLAILLEQPGTIVTREELQKRLWPDTFVDVDHNLNTAVNKIREVLGDSAESPRFVETLPRRGYRFVAPVEGAGAAKTPAELLNSGMAKPAPPRGRALRVSMLIVASALLAGTGFFIYKRRQVSELPGQRTLTRVTFDDGLQIDATWSPDDRYIAFSSDRGGKFDIWVQQVSGGDPIQITKGRVKIGSRIGLRMANTSRIVPRKVTEEYTLSRRLGVQDSNGRSHLSATTLGGPRTACRCCSRLISLR